MVSPQAKPHTIIREGKQSSELKANRLLVAGLLVYLSALFCYSLYLSQSRLLQVDECQNVYMARVLATGQAQEFFTNGSLFLLGPLAWITRNLHHSTQIFDAARLVFLAVFWLNISLMAAIVGGRLFSLRRLIALVAAASLAPVWDYGFEIRHDNLVLTGVLLIWWAVRVRLWGWPSYLLTGAITAALSICRRQSCGLCDPFIWRAFVVASVEPKEIPIEIYRSVGWRRIVGCGACSNLLRNQRSVGHISFSVSRSG